MAREIAQVREEHFEAHDYYIDADGAAYVANVDSRTGDIELEREEREEARGNDPAKTNRRSHRIHADGSRTNRGITAATTQEDGRPVEHVRTETQRLAADGSVRGSQIAVDQARENADGSTDRSHTAENYDAHNRATSRVQRQEHRAANGDGQVDETTTQLGADGQTPTDVRNHSEVTRGGDVATRDTTTSYASDGTTPRSQSVAEGGTNPDGSPKLGVTALTHYDQAGDPATTFIRRDGELPAHTPATEYLTWGGDGDVARRVTGDASISEREYAGFVKDGARPRAGSVQEADPADIPGSQDPTRFTKGSDGRFDGAAVQGNLVKPLEPSDQTPSVFEIPAAVRARASAEAIDSSRYATDPAARQRLDQEQRAFEQQLAGASSDAQREQLMRAYFGEHEYWIDRGGEGAEPVLMAAAWSGGAPSSAMFGGDRAAQPHATMARTGIAGQDDVGNAATIDVVANLYTDGSRDDITRTSHDGPAGAERTVVSGDHTNAAGVVTERDVNAQSRVARTEQGLSPLAATEVTRERFHETTGKPQGEQYYAVETSDDRTTKLEEKRDQYGADGVIQDTRIESTEMSRNFAAGITGDFLAENQRVIDDALDGGLDINQVGTSITVPPIGSFSTRESTDIDYDASGRPVFQQTDSDTTAVSGAGDENGNGVRVTTTDSTKTLGERGGTTPIFDAEGNRLVKEDAVATISTNEFDPDAGGAGGNKGTGFQSRETASLTRGTTTQPNGNITDEWATPLTTQTLLEGHDDDWIADEKHLKTNATGELVDQHGTPLKDAGEKARPVELEAGDRVRDRSGNEVGLARGSRHQEDLEFADKFEGFMEGWGGKIIGVAAIAAGIGGAIFTGGASLGLATLGFGLTTTAVGLAGTQFAYTKLNHSQGEASGRDLLLAGASVAFMGLVAVRGVHALGAVGRASSAGRTAAGAADEIALRSSDDALRGGGAPAASNGTRAAKAAGVGLDGVDAYDAGRAALHGDFYGAALMFGAVVGGGAAGRAYSRRTGAGADGTGSATPANPTDVPPSTSSGAPAVRTSPTGGSSTQSVPGTNTGDGGTTSVAGAHGAGAEGGIFDVGRLPARSNDAARAESVRRIENGEPMFGDPEVDLEFRSMLAARRITDPSAQYEAALSFARTTRANVLWSARAEPRLTAEVSAAADAAGARLVQLDSRTKSEGSLRRKAAHDGADDVASTERDLATGISDPVRYSAVLDPDSYVAGMDRLVTDLRARGFEVVSDANGQPKLKNRWVPKPGGTRVPMVNLQFVNPHTGQRFEVQAHTPDSHVASIATHAIYERMRLLDEGSAEYARLDAERAAINAGVPDPPGIGNFGPQAAGGAHDVLPSRFGRITRSDGTSVGVPRGNLDFLPGQEIHVRLPGRDTLAIGRIESVADDQVVVTHRGADGQPTRTTIHANELAVRQPHLLLGEEIGVRFPDQGVQVHEGWSVVRVLEGGNQVLVTDGTTTHSVSTRAIAPNPGEIRFVTPAERAAISGGSRVLLFETTPDSSRFVGGDSNGSRPTSPEHLRIAEGFERAIAHHASLTGRPILPDGRPLRVEVNEAYRGDGAFDVSGGRIIVGPDADVVTILHEVGHGTNQAILGVDLMQFGNRSQLRILDEGLAELRASLHLRSFDTHHHPAAADPGSIADRIRSATLADPHHAIPLFQRMGRTLSGSLEATAPGRGFEVADDLVGRALVDMGARPVNHLAAVDEFAASLRSVVAGRYGAGSAQARAVEVALADSGLATPVGDRNAFDALATHRAERRHHAVIEPGDAQRLPESASAHRSAARAAALSSVPGPPDGDIRLTTSRELTQRERNAISAYVMGQGYRLNADLNAGRDPYDGPPDGTTIVAPADLMRRLDGAMTTSQLSAAIRLHRGLVVPEETFLRIVETGRFSHPAYASTSSNPDVALRFAESTAPGRRAIVLHLDVPAGTPLLAMSNGAFTEGEFLLPRGAEFRDLRISIDDAGVAHAHGTVTVSMPPKEGSLATDAEATARPAARPAVPRPRSDWWRHPDRIDEVLDHASEGRLGIGNIAFGRDGITVSHTDPFGIETAVTRDWEGEFDVSTDADPGALADSFSSGYDSFDSGIDSPYPDFATDQSAIDPFYDPLATDPLYQPDWSGRDSFGTEF